MKKEIDANLIKKKSIEILNILSMESMTDTIDILTFVTVSVIRALTEGAPLSIKEEIADKLCRDMKNMLIMNLNKEKLN